MASKVYHFFMGLLFPPKCVLCRCTLEEDQTDLCHTCRKTVPAVGKPAFRIPNLSGWTVLWPYKDQVRRSILRFKFHHRRSYGAVFGRLLAMKLMHTGWDRMDVITWVPVSPIRKWRRGYDQGELIARAVAREMNIKACPCFRKRRNNKPQSSFKDAAKRRANVEGVFRVLAPETLAGKRVLLIDDIITTGATLSECGKQLQFIGCTEIYGAALAVSVRDKESR